jgi:serine/threonine protein kinase
MTVPIFLSQIQSELKSLKRINKNNYNKLIKTVKNDNNIFREDELLCEYLKNYYNDHDIKKAYAYDNDGEKVFFYKPIRVSTTQNVYLGKYFSKHGSTKYVVIKWVSGTTRTIQEEMNTLDKLSKNNVTLPKYRTDFLFMGKPVLFEELLKPVDGSENALIVGITILEILKNMHKLCVHSDIKPDNILKKDNNTIYLIDFGGVSFSKLEYGYRRRCWSSKWTSQHKKSNQITTAKHDLVELGHTIRGLQLMKKNKRISTESIRDMKHEPMITYMNLVNNLDKKNIDSEIYDKLINLLKQYV